MRSIRHAAVAALIGAAGTATTAQAQWLPTYQTYSVQRSGLFGPAQTGSAGVQLSLISFAGTNGVVAGTSARYNAAGSEDGQNTWVFNPGVNATVQTGLFGPAYTTSNGGQYSANDFINAAGQVAGVSRPVEGGRIADGNWDNTWVYNPSTNQTVRTGLTGPQFTQANGRQRSQNQFQSSLGYVVGISSALNRGGMQAAWLYNPVTNTTVETGLQGPEYNDANGIRYSDNNFVSPGGYAAGWSFVFRPGSIAAIGGLGVDSWLYNPVTNTTVRTGLTGSIYTGPDGSRGSDNQRQNALGAVAGVSGRYSTTGQVLGRDTWVFNPATGASVQTGFTGPGYVDNAGFQYGQNDFLTDGGFAVGWSQRRTSANVGGDFSSNLGATTWIYNTHSNTTVQTGLVGSTFTSELGIYVSTNSLANASGYVVGLNDRYRAGGFNNGVSSWAYNPSTNTTVQTGLTAPAHTGSQGYQVSRYERMNGAGQAVGWSQRIINATDDNGQNSWVYVPTTGATVQIGLTSSAHTGTNGYQFSQTFFQNEAGQVVGFSRRVTGSRTNNGGDAWVYDPGTNTTLRLGLLGSVYTSSIGYQSSFPQFQNAAGQVAGYSNRIRGNSTFNGQDAWYFDPTTLVSSAVIGSVRTTDNYAFSAATILTEGGFLLGNYTFFAGGLGSGEQRAFIFRPDLGFTDLGNLVDGGLTANGWITLQNPRFSDALTTIVGYGLANGQTSRQSVFVMTVPAPTSAALLGVAGLIAARRRRA